VLRLDAVDGRQRTAEHVVEAPVLVRALDGDEVGRLLDDADHRPVAPRVQADLTHVFLSEVPALAAEADALLDLRDGGGEGACFVLRDAK
jgi:hypothetical protein